MIILLNVTNIKKYDILSHHIIGLGEGLNMRNKALIRINIIVAHCAKRALETIKPV